MERGMPTAEMPNARQEWEALPACFATSSREGKGRSELLGHLASLRALDAGESTAGDGPWTPDDD
jgi:hypothetical protein